MYFIVIRLLLGTKSHIEKNSLHLSLSLSLSLSLRLGLLLKLELGRQPVSPSNPTLSVPHGTGVAGSSCHVRFFTWMLGFELGTLSLHSKRSHPQTISPASVFSTFLTCSESFFGFWDCL